MIVENSLILGEHKHIILDTIRKSERQFLRENCKFTNCEVYFVVMKIVYQVRNLATFSTQSYCIYGFPLLFNQHTQ